MSTSTLYRIANAPCSWGVDFADRAENPHWHQVMDEVAAAGYSAIDLGPVGYFPTDPLQLKDELDSRGLVLSAGGLFDPLTIAASFPAIVEKTHRTCKILRALEAPRLVIIDCVSTERGSTAGRSDVAPRLGAMEWKAMISRIAEIARIASSEYGVAPSIHAHAGCYMEFEDELDRAMADLPEELIGLCVDTGHCAYAGIDPVALIRRYRSRVIHVHFKDIDPLTRSSCLANGIDFFTAVASRIFCPLGMGMVDFAAIHELLTEVNYNGMIVVEQDVDPSGDASSFENARASHRFLASVGTASRQTPSA